MGVGGLGGLDDDDDISNKVAGIGVLSGLTKVFGPKLGGYIFNQGRNKIINEAKKKAIDEVKAIEQANVAKAAARRAELQAIQKKLDDDPRGTGPGGGGASGPYGGGAGGLHSDYADGGLASMFMERR